MIKRIVSILLIITLSVVLYSCDGRSSNNEPTTTEGYILPTEIVDSDVSLPYTSAENFNPYVAKGTLNRDLIPVLYESLYLPTDSGEGVPLLALSGEVNSKSATVKLKTGLKFSDGSSLTTAHIKSSFEKAKNNDFYKDSLSNISTIKIIDNSTIVFSFYKESPFTLNTLVFPIIKEENNRYVGSGKYKLQYLEKMPYLSVNNYHREYSESWNKQIVLYDMSGKTGPIYPFKANEISVYTNNLSNEKYINLSSQTVSQGLNNLVYIGVNSKWAGSVTSIDWVRHAINIGVDRSSVAASSYLGQSTPVVTPFKTAFYQLKSDDLPSINGELQKAVGILERNGYTKLNADGIRTNGSSTLRIDILVCSQNEYKVGVAEAVKKTLEDIGFGVTITQKKTPEEFETALKEGHFGLYIGETQLSYNYDLTEFFSKNGNLCYGIDELFFEEYELYDNGESSTMSFIESFETEVPFIPLFYRKSIASVNPNITGVDKGNVYASVSQWKIPEK